MTSQSTDLLIVGGGMAAARLVQCLQKQGYARKISVASSESVFGYNRVLLPDLISGRHAMVDLLPGRTAWRHNPNISVLEDTRVLAIDPRHHMAVLSTGSNIHFDTLVLATGSKVPLPGIPGAEAPFVTQLRSLCDAQRIQRLLQGARQVVVIGGGLLGLEAADSLREMGLGVRIVHRGPRLMTHQIDDPCGALLQDALIDRGIDVSLNAEVNEIRPHHHRGGELVLSNGEAYTTDLVVCATGAMPNDALAQHAGLACASGVITDECLRTSRAHIYALGECANVAGRHHQLVEPVYVQAEALTRTLCGQDTPVPDLVINTRLKIRQMPLLTAGDIRPPGANDITIVDAARKLYRRLLFEGDTLIGALLLGDTRGSREITSRIGTPLKPTDAERLVFGVQQEYAT